MPLVIHETADLPIMEVDVDIKRRLFPPTDKRVKELAKALQADGRQYTPIMVRRVTSNTYKVISGAARVLAMRNLGWHKVRAEIVGGLDVDYRIAELSENHDRHDLTRAQRSEISRQLRDLRMQREQEAVSDVSPHKGGRGHRGGLREAARQAGISIGTAHRRQKVFQNVQSGTVSPKQREPVAVSASDAVAKMIDDASKMSAATVLHKTCPTCRGKGYIE